MVLRELRRGGYEVTHTLVDKAEDFNRALDQGSWDVIIADYALPRFYALAAFQLVKQRGLDVPFLSVSDKNSSRFTIATSSLTLSATDLPPNAGVSQASISGFFAGCLSRSYAC